MSRLFRFLEFLQGSNKMIFAFFPILFYNINAYNEKTERIVTMIRFLTAGESHGPALTAIIEGFPAGLRIDFDRLQSDMDARRRGYGRGGRMRIEGDSVEILSGVRHGLTMGSPITLQIHNRDFERWQEAMAIQESGKDIKVDISADERLKNVEAKLTKPRPGHADLPGSLKYRTDDVRNILERASARETAMRVAVGSLARQLLMTFGMEVSSGVLQIGSAVADDWQELNDAMKAEIDAAKALGDSVGGIIKVKATGVPVGLGSHVHWDRRLDARLAGAMMSIPAIKGVNIGLGFEMAGLPGSKVHDSIIYNADKGFGHVSNNAGGIEGGISNGEDIWMTLMMKPIPTLYNPLPTVDIQTKETAIAGVERSDTCAVEAAGIVAEAMMCWVLAEMLIEKFGGDSIAEIKERM